MSGALDTIRAAIVAKLATVPGIGRVHDYERYAKELNSLLAFYQAEDGAVDQLRGWFVRRVATQRTSPALGRKVITNRWHISGRMALEDSSASEKVFDDLIEAIAAAFEADENLGGICTTVVEDSAGIQVIESMPVMFGPVLCHAATLALTTRHYQ